MFGRRLFPIRLKSMRTYEWRTKMKKIICTVLSIILAFSALCVNAFAAKMYTCTRCGTIGTAVKKCSGNEVYAKKDHVPCNYRNNTFDGLLHLGTCEVERHYCETDYYCTACYDAYPANSPHMCWIIHTKVQGMGTYYRSVCSTYLDMNYNMI